MKRDQKLAIIKSTKGKIFTATFIKKDGSERVMNARLGVKSPLLGGVNTVAHLPQYVTVFDMQKKAYRNLNLDSIKSIRTGQAEMVFS